VQPIDPTAQETLARFRDPAGNVLGIYQQPGLAAAEAGATAAQADLRSVAPIPEHLRTVTPRLVVSNGVEAIEFYRSAFGAEEVVERFAGPDGELIHAEVRIGDSIVMITEDAGDAAPARAPQSLGGVVSAIMVTYWENVDAAWERAIGAGAEVVYPLADQFYGERGGRLRDPYGQQWMLSQRIEHLSHEEIARRVRPSPQRP
jgi:PhnB protein